MTLIQDMRAALANPVAVAGTRAALEMLRGWHGSTVYRLPGCGTLGRMTYAGIPVTGSQRVAGPDLIGI